MLLLAGCTGEEPAPTTAPTSAAPAPSPTPTPTPTPTATGPMDRSDAALGIQFENLPDVTGDARAALDLYTLFEVEFWRSTTQGAVSDLMPVVANPAVVAVVQTQVDGNASRGLTINGETRVRILDVVADPASATITTCQDPTAATVTYADGTVKSVGEAGAMALKVVAGLHKEPDLPWQVVTIENSGEAC
ncbi:hypothetical protein [Cellulomonas sp. P5_C5]